MWCYYIPTREVEMQVSHIIVGEEGWNRVVLCWWEFVNWYTHLGCDLLLSTHVEHVPALDLSVSFPNICNRILVLQTWWRDPGNFFCQNHIHYLPFPFSFCCMCIYSWIFQRSMIKLMFWQLVGYIFVYSCVKDIPVLTSNIITHSYNSHKWKLFRVLRFFRVYPKTSLKSTVTELWLPEWCAQTITFSDPLVDLKKSTLYFYSYEWT